MSQCPKLLQVHVLYSDDYLIHSFYYHHHRMSLGIATLDFSPTVLTQVGKIHTRKFWVSGQDDIDILSFFNFIDPFSFFIVEIVCSIRWYICYDTFVSPTCFPLPASDRKRQGFCTSFSSIAMQRAYFIGRIIQKTGQRCLDISMSPNLEIPPTETLAIFSYCCSHRFQSLFGFCTVSYHQNQ